MTIRCSSWQFNLASIIKKWKYELFVDAILLVNKIFQNMGSMGEKGIINARFMITKKKKKKEAKFASHYVKCFQNAYFNNYGMYVLLCLS